mmetsp:Transcript_26448/g.36374  ORF Transcript_26448/g.36374 Transcript_26448/m.36374 type:complete len:1042 (+) Transcript_26448:41-3166(+)
MNSTLFERDVSKFFFPNPRKIMRITNTYRINRLIATTKFQYSTPIDRKKLNSLKKKILIWIVLIEQWPIRVSWLLQVLEDEDQLGSLLNLQNDSLADFYKKYIELRIYNNTSMLGCPASLTARYEKILFLDADPEIFENLLRVSKILVKDIGSFSERNYLSLLPYTIGLNPAIRSIIGSLAAYRPDSDTIADAVKPHFLLSVNKIKNFNVFNRLTSNSIEAWIQSVLKNGPKESVTTISERIKTNDIDGPLMHRIICGGSKDIFSPIPDYEALAKLGVEDRLLQQIVITKWCQWINSMMKKQKYISGKIDADLIADDVESNNSPTGQRLSLQLPKPDEQQIIGYLDYAVAFAALMRHGVTAPVILGLYSTGGSGKSYVLELVFAAIKTLWLHEKLEHFKGIEINNVSTNKANNSEGKSNENYAFKNQQVVGSENLPDDVESSMLTSLYNQPQSYNSFADPASNDRSEERTPLSEGETSSDGVKGSRTLSFSSFHGAEEETAEQQLQKMMFTRQDSIDDVFLWYKLGCPTDAFLQTEVCILDKIRVRELWERRNVEFSWMLALSTIFSRFYGYFVGLTVGIWQRWFGCDPMDPFDKRNGKMYKYLRDAREGIALEREALDKALNFAVTSDYEFTRWNAWLYSGSDNLWAGLIKALYDSVEDHYGPNYKHAHQKSYMLMIVLLCLVSLTCLTKITWSEMNGLNDSDVESILSLLGAILSAVIAVLAQLYSQLKPSEKVLSMVESDEFKSKLGFMASIKEEIQKIGNLLKDPESVPTMWDFFFTWTGPLKPYLKCFFEKYLGGGLHLRYLNPCELVICVDELDRCPPKLAVEVLRSLVLLTEDTPFIILLTLDPRLIVSAIESENSSFYSEAGVSGYEYLDKIVSMPFSIPQMVDNEKTKFCESYIDQQRVDVLLQHCNKTYPPTSNTSGNSPEVNGRIFSAKSKILNRSIKELQVSLECYTHGDQEVEFTLYLFKQEIQLEVLLLFGKFKGRKRDKFTLRAHSEFVLKAVKDCHFEVVCNSADLSRSNNQLYVKNLFICCKYF